MLLDASQVAFMLIDVQTKLMPLTQEHQAVTDKCAWLLELANALQLPVVVSEQYPKGLGPTSEQLQPYIQGKPTFAKMCFSAGKDAGIMHYLKQQRFQQIILFGIEAHVCVLQSALDLKKAGFDVFVVADAITARHAISIDIALTRMRHAGIHIITSEMVFFELLQSAEHPEFKTLSKRFF